MFKSRVVVWSIIGTRISRTMRRSVADVASNCLVTTVTVLCWWGRGRGATVPIETASNVLLLNLLAKWLVVLYCVHKHERHLFSRCCCLETLSRPTRFFPAFWCVVFFVFDFYYGILDEYGGATRKFDEARFGSRWDDDNWFISEQTRHLIEFNAM